MIINGILTGFQRNQSFFDEKCVQKKRDFVLSKWVFYSISKAEKIKIYMIVCKCSKDILSFKDMID